MLETGQGRAEVLLTPGVFLRVGDNSAVRLISPGLADTRVEVLRGQAIVEVAELFKDNNLSVLMDGASTRLAKARPVRLQCGFPYGAGLRWPGHGAAK